MPLPRPLPTTAGAQPPGRISVAAAAVLDRGSVDGTPRAVCFPRDDPRLAARAQALIDGAGPGGPITTVVQARLREDYPRVVISPRHPLAAFDGARVWYVFREGTLVPASPVGDPATLPAHAVLRRERHAAPLRLGGVLLAGTFHPLTAQDAWDQLHLEGGEVALAPLTPVMASEATAGATDAMLEACRAWSDPEVRDGALLRWVPLDQVRGGTEGDVAALFVRASLADDLRVSDRSVASSAHGAELPRPYTPSTQALLG